MQVSHQVLLYTYVTLETPPVADCRFSIRRREGKAVAPLSKRDSGFHRDVCLASFVILPLFFLPHPLPS
jgi:hypothetical protein